MEGAGGPRSGTLLCHAHEHCCWSVGVCHGPHAPRASWRVLAAALGKAAKASRRGGAAESATFAGLLAVGGAHMCAGAHSAATSAQGLAGIDDSHITKKLRPDMARSNWCLAQGFSLLVEKQAALVLGQWRRPTG